MSPGHLADHGLGDFRGAGARGQLVNAEISKLMSSPDTKKALYDAGVEVSPSTPEAMSDYMVQELNRWGKVVKDTGIKIE